MVKIAYDVDGVEEFDAYSGPTPKRGVYEAVIVSGDFRESRGGHNMFEIIVRIDTKKKEHKQYNGCPLWQYYVIGDQSEDWMKRNMKSVSKVFLAGKDKGSFDPDALAKKMEGKKVRVVVKNELYKNPDIDNDEGTMTAKANGLLPFKPAEDEAASEPEPDGDAEPEDAGDGDEPEGDEPEGDEPEGDEAEGDESTVEEDIADLDRAALKAYIIENKETIPSLVDDQGRAKVYKKDSDDDIRTKIIEAWPDGDDEPEGDEPPF